MTAILETSVLCDDKYKADLKPSHAVVLMKKAEKKNLVNLVKDTI